MTARTLAFALATCTLLSTTISSASVPLCPAGPKDFLKRAPVVVQAKPKSLEMKKRETRYYLRATYELQKAIRGEVGEEITVEISCVDKKWKPAVPTAQYPGGHCPRGKEVTLPGFERDGAEFRPGEALVLYLTLPGDSGLDGSPVHGDVTDLRISRCEDDLKAMGEYPEGDAFIAWLEKIEPEFPAPRTVGGTPKPATQIKEARKKPEPPAEETGEKSEEPQKPPAPEKTSSGCSITGLH